MPVTVEELDSLIKKYNEKQEELDKIEEKLKEENKLQEALLVKVSDYLKELDRDEYKSPFGEAKIKERRYVTNPQTDEEKRAFFEHLRERGIFEKYATVNSKSLNSLYFADYDSLPDEEKIIFNMPGIKPHTVLTSSSIKPLKKK